MELSPDEEQLRQVMAWYPNKTLYSRTSSKSGKPLISVYPEGSPHIVYSHDEWYADDYSPKFLEADLNRSFFEQFGELLIQTPLVALLSTLQENAEYCQDVEGLKNCYLVFDAINCQDVLYSVRVYNSRSCTDVYWVMESELLYDSVFMFSCYNCRHSFNCKQVSDSYFLFNCRNVKNSFMCSNLRNKEYCLYNKEVSKEEFEDFMKGVDLSDFEEIEKLKKHFIEEIVNKTPIPHAFLENCENVDGNYVKNSKNCSRCVESFDLQDCTNVFQCAKGKNIVGSFMCNDRVEQCFQCVATGIGSFNVRNCAFVWHSSNMEYCYLCMSCLDCFGCVGLRNKRYHIFNKSYSKEKYERLRDALIEKMKNREEYDRFSPMNLSPFRYEDTIAFDFFGDGKPGPMKLQIIPQERKFYEKHRIPFPKQSFTQRYRMRLDLMDTSLTKIKGTYFKDPERKKIVSDEEYEKSLR